MGNFNKKLSIALFMGIQAYCGHGVMAQTSAEADLKGTVRSVIDSPTLYDTSLTMQNNFRNATNSVGDKEVKLAQQNLPKPVQGDVPQAINAGTLGLPNPSFVVSDIRSVGKLVVVSPRGAEAITLIRDLAPAKKGTEEKTLASLQAMAAEGVPEAQNFIGYVYEYGLYGVTPNIDRAEQFYLAASKQGYGTATYNLATIRFYGKGGRKPDLRLAETLAASAADSTAEASFRICGLASFTAYRSKNSKSGVYSKNCSSPLAALGRAAYTKDGTLEERVLGLKGSIATGANDGFGALVQLAMTTPPDQTMMYCRYWLGSQYQFNTDLKSIKDLATRCYTTSNTIPDLNSAVEKPIRKQRIDNLIAMVKTDLSGYKTQRASNKISYSISVPFLPFHQSDVTAWEKNITKKAN